MTHPFSLAGRHALVTGAACGVRQAIADALAQAGAHVTITGPAASTGAAQLGAAERARGPIDILVNNSAPLDGAADWRAVFCANLDAPWRLAQEAARRMAERGGGKIVNVASPLALRRGLAHAAGNDALAGLTKALADEFAPLSVNVNGIAPGGIATEQPVCVGHACVFLCSRASDSIHGQVLAIGSSFPPVQRT